MGWSWSSSRTPPHAHTSPDRVALTPLRRRFDDGRQSAYSGRRRLTDHAPGTMDVPWPPRALVCDAPNDGAISDRVAKRRTMAARQRAAAAPQTEASDLGVQLRPRESAAARVTLAQRPGPGGNARSGGAVRNERGARPTPGDARKPGATSRGHIEPGRGHPTRGPCRSRSGEVVSAGPVWCRCSATMGGSCG